MKTRVSLLLLLAAPSAFAYSIPTEEFFLPGNNAYYTAVPNPAAPGFAMEGIAMVRTEAQMALGVTSYSGFPAGVLNNTSGITILVGPYGGIVEALNAQHLTVGPSGSAAIRTYNIGVFTEIFGIYSPNTFGFAGMNFLDGFGIAGSPIFFASDGPFQDANRFRTPAGYEAGYAQAYISNPATATVPDGGGTSALLLLGACGLLLSLRRFDL